MNATSAQNSSPDAGEGPDWGVLVQRVQERMYLSQVAIANRCGVARQTVSAWLNGRRKPGLYAKRELLILAAEAGVLDEVAPQIQDGASAGESEGLVFRSSENRQRPREELEDARQLRILLKQLSPSAREEVLEFARFKIFRERG